MRRFSLFVVVVCVLALGEAASPASAEDRWIEIDPSAPGTEIDVVVNETPGGVAVDIALAGFFVDEQDLPAGRFSTLDIPGCGINGAVGEPSIPFRTVLVPVPNGPAASLEWSGSTSRVALGDTMVMPQQRPQPDCGDGEVDFTIDDKAYAADRWYPSEAARIADDVVVRGQRFLVVEARPLSFNPVRREVVARPELHVSIGLDGAVDEAAEALKAARHNALFPTAADLDGAPGSDANPTGIEYLIIADDPLAPAFEPLAEWKRKKGLTVEIVLMSTIGSSVAELASYLQNRYDADPDLTYVLLGGDYPTIPSETLNHPLGGTYVSDVVFSCLDGTDYLPDVVMSRIAVDSLTDCQNVVSKILAWDRDVVPGAWHGDYLMAAYLQGGCTAQRWFFETGTHAMHYIRDEAGMGIHTAATSDTLNCNPYYFRSDSYPHRPEGYAGGQPVPEADGALITNASTSTQDITDAINGGVSLVQHRDHGGETGWGDPPYHNSEVLALANGGMTPIVYSINCLTGKFNLSSDCFADAFMKKYPGGAVGVMAATESSMSGYNDLIVHGSYDSFWDDYDPADGGNIYPHSFRPAEAYLYGKYYMYNWEGAGATYTELQVRLFHWHGDPEMMAYTTVPSVLSVTTEPTMTVGSSTLTVSGGVDGALVAVTDGGALLGRAEVAGGVAVVDLDPVPETPTTLDVVVSGHNLVPWQGTVEVIVDEGPWMVHSSHVCDDSAGNGDGIANPGETIVLPVSVENVGVDDGTGISGALSSDSAEVPVTDAAALFPDAVIGAVVQSLPDHFAVAVSPTAPNGHSAELTLDWAADGGYAGSTVFSLPVCEALVISDVAVDSIDNDSAVVSWTTNVPASSVVTWGETAPPSTAVESTQATTAHTLEITGLDECTGYIFQVASTSPDCYTTVDDNGGAYHGFTTSGGTPVTADAVDTPVAIPDNNPTGGSSYITVDSPYSVLDVNVLVDITHTYTADLELLLISPTGTEITLSDGNGGSGHNYTQTLFDDDAATSITGGSAPFTGSFQPEEPLATLIGEDSAGTWEFKVVDSANVDTGTIDAWQLQLTVDEPCGALFADDFEDGTGDAWSLVEP